MKKHSLPTFSAIAAAAVLLLGVSAPAVRQQPVRARAVHPAAAQQPPVAESRPGLLAKAVVRPAAAERVALRAMPGARVVERRIEQRSGRIVYLFRMRDRRGAPRLVMVDAMTGRVVPIRASGGAR